MEEQGRPNSERFDQPIFENILTERLVRTLPQKNAEQSDWFEKDQGPLGPSKGPWVF